MRSRAGRAHRFFVPAAATGVSCVLDAAESARARRVLRLPDGASIQVFDGKGGAYLATVSGPAPGGRVQVACAEPLATPESTVQLTVGIAIPKGDGMTAVVRQLAELGVARVAPLLTERSEGSAAPSRRKRWEAAALSGTRQCGGALVPEVTAPARLSDWMAGALPETRLIAAPGAGSEPDRRHTGNRVVLVIGPEGGFSPAEAEAARACGFQARRLGNRVLRTGTAAVVAAARILIPAPSPNR